MVVSLSPAVAIAASLFSPSRPQTQDDTSKQQQQQQQQQPDDEAVEERGREQRRYHAIRRCTTGLEGPAIFWKHQDVQPYLLPPAKLNEGIHQQSEQVVDYRSFDNILDAVEYIEEGGGGGGGGEKTADDAEVATIFAQAAATLATGPETSSAPPGNNSNNNNNNYNKESDERIDTFPIHDPDDDDIEIVESDDEQDDSDDDDEKNDEANEAEEEDDRNCVSKSSKTTFPIKMKKKNKTTKQQQQQQQKKASTTITTSSSSSSSFQQKQEQYWEDMFQLLVQYKNRYGPASINHIPTRFTSDEFPKLGSWLHSTLETWNYYSYNPPNPNHHHHVNLDYDNEEEDEEEDDEENPPRPTIPGGLTQEKMQRLVALGIIAPVTAASTSTTTTAATVEGSSGLQATTTDGSTESTIPPTAATSTTTTTTSTTRKNKSSTKARKAIAATTTTADPSRPTKKRRVKAPASTKQRLETPKTLPPSVLKRRQMIREKANAEWERMLGELKIFRDTHGHANVPQRPRTALYNWVNKQRKHYNWLKAGDARSVMTAPRIQRMTELGFKFQTSKRSNFEERSVEWLTYHTTHGGKDPTHGHPTGLEKWVRKLRRRYELLQGQGDDEDNGGDDDDEVDDGDGAGSNTDTMEEGAANTAKEKKKPSISLTQAQIDKLTQWGFNWKSSFKKPTKITKPAPWQKRFEELLEFKQEHGHTVVPQLYPVLGHWVHRQRKEFKKYQAGVKCSISEDQVQKLLGAGFLFHATTRGARGLVDSNVNVNTASSPTTKSKPKQPPRQQQQQRGTKKPRGSQQQQGHRGRADVAYKRNETDEEEDVNDDNENDSMSTASEEVDYAPDYHPTQTQQLESHVNQTLTGGALQHHPYSHNYQNGNWGGGYPPPPSGGGGSGNPRAFPGFWG